jgi:RND superfamily putative drug exporter
MTDMTTTQKPESRGSPIMHRTSSPQQTGILARWARIAVRHRRLVLAAWVAGLILLIGVAGTFGGTLSTTFEVPGTESQRAFDLLRERFPQQAGDSALVVFHAESGLAEPAIRQRIESVLAQAAVLPGVTAVSSPFGADGRGALAGDGHIGYATVQYGEQASSVPKADVDRLFALVDGATDGFLTVEAGGAVVQALEQQPPGSKEAIGLLIAAVILLIAFGSVVAMGLPIATALVGLGAGFALAGLVAASFDISQFTLTFGIMIGLGVGIDYALFVVTRFRDGLREGHSVEDSIVLAIATAGGAVVFAGLVVMLALLGTAANGIPAVTAFGITGSLFVAMGVLVALTLSGTDSPAASSGGHSPGSSAPSRCSSC